MNSALNRVHSEARLKTSVEVSLSAWAQHKRHACGYSNMVCHCLWSAQAASGPSPYLTQIVIKQPMQKVELIDRYYDWVWIPQGKPGLLLPWTCLGECEVLSWQACKMHSYALVTCTLKPWSYQQKSSHWLHKQNKRCIHPILHRLIAMVMNDYQELLSSYTWHNNELQVRGPNISIQRSSVELQKP